MSIVLSIDGQNSDRHRNMHCHLTGDLLIRVTLGIIGRKGIIGRQCKMQNALGRPPLY